MTVPRRARLREPDQAKHSIRVGYITAVAALLTSLATIIALFIR